MMSHYSQYKGQSFGRVLHALSCYLPIHIVESIYEKGIGEIYILTKHLQHMNGEKILKVMTLQYFSSMVKTQSNIITFRNVGCRISTTQSNLVM